MRRGAAIAVLAALVAVAALPGTGHAAKRRVERPFWVCSAKAPNCGTLVVHVGFANRRLRKIGGFGSAEYSLHPIPLNGGVILASTRHTLRVSPGAYIIALDPFGGTASEYAEFTVSARQTKEVALTRRATPVRGA